MIFGGLRGDHPKAGKSELTPPYIMRFWNFARPPSPHRAQEQNTACFGVKTPFLILQVNKVLCVQIKIYIEKLFYYDLADLSCYNIYNKLRSVYHLS